jgi:uncharacterized protein
MIIVSNTTPLIGLASIQRFDILHNLFGNIVIAQAVYDEAVSQGHEEGGAKKEVANAEWIRIAQVSDRLAVEVLLDEMDMGEAETIVLAAELKANWVLMDEKKGRRKLSQMEIPKIGTVGILLEAKRRGLIKSVKPELEKLHKQGFSISQFVVETAVKQAGE